MLDVGTRISLELVKGKEPVNATILHCSATGRSCRVELDNEEVRSINLPQHAYTILAAAGSGDTDTGPTSEPFSDEEGSGGSDESEEVSTSPSDDSEDELGVLDVMTPDQAEALTALTAAASPTAFLQPSATLASLARSAARALYAVAADGAAAQRTSGPSPDILPELYVDGFDPEQIWIQLDMLGGPALKHARRLLRKARDDISLITPENEEALDELLGLGSEDEQDDDDIDDDSASGEADLDNVNYEAMLAAGDGLGDESGKAGAGSEALSARKTVSKRALAAVEDDYLKLDEMEAFLQDAERVAALEEEQGDRDEDPEEAALEAALSKAAQKAKKKSKKRASKFPGLVFGDEDMDGDEDDEDAALGRDAKYEDFFGPRKPGPNDHGFQMPDRQSKSAAALQASLEDKEQAGSSDDESEPGSEGEDGLDAMLATDDEVSEDSDEEAGSTSEAGSEDESDEEGEDDRDGGAAGSSDDEDAEFVHRPGGLELAAVEPETQRLSTHEKQMAKMAVRIKSMEAEAMAAKDWFLRGEIGAGQRPLNSALEVDLDYDTTVAPAPVPTEESAASLEDRIRARIRDGRFDSVVRVAPPPEEKKVGAPELDDKRSTKGLAELYEEDYVKTVTGYSEDKDEPIRASARTLFAKLCAKLDTLSHLHFRPAPVIEESGFRSDAPAILMEEVAPQFVSEASQRAPEEVHAALSKGGVAPAETELEREERKRRRAQRKRGAKKFRAAKQAERAAQAQSVGGLAPIAGRKSELEAVAAAKKTKRGAAPEAKPLARGHYTKSKAVFAGIQSRQDASKRPAEAVATTGPSAKKLRL